MARKLERAAPASAVPSSEVAAALVKVLGSDGLKVSDRCKRFLSHVVNETLAGRGSRIKAYTIAVEVFERGIDFDPTNDPIVRIEAGRLRRALETYYLTAGADEPVRIEIPRGSYVPHFGYRSPAPVPKAADQGGPEPAIFLPRSIAGRLGPATRPRSLAALLCALALLTFGWWLGAPRLQGAPRVDAEQPVSQALGPVVRVLPFHPLSSDPEDRLLGRALSGELVTSLRRFDRLRIFQAERSPGESIYPPLAVGDAVPDFTIDGNIARDGQRIRATVRLVSTQSGEVFASQVYDRVLTAASLLDLEAEMAANMASRLAEPSGIVHRISASMFRTNAPDSLFIYRCIYRAHEYRRLFGGKDLYPEVRACLAESVEREPGYADAWAMLAFVQLEGARYGFAPPDRRPQEFEASLVSAERAYELNPRNVVALQSLSAAVFFRGEFERAEKLLRIALELNPNLPETHAQLGWRMVVRSRGAEGMAYMRRAIELSVMPPRWYYMVTSLDAYFRGDFEEALYQAEFGVGGCCGLGELVKAIAEAKLGRLAQAQASLEQAFVQVPALRADPLAIFRAHKVDDSSLSAIAEGLQGAGAELPLSATRPGT